MNKIVITRVLVKRMIHEVETVTYQNGRTKERPVLKSKTVLKLTPNETIEASELEAYRRKFADNDQIVILEYYELPDEISIPSVK